MKKKSLYIAGICAALSVGALGCASSAKAGDEENKTAVEDTKAAGETTAAETSESNTVIEKNAPSGPASSFGGYQRFRHDRQSVGNQQCRRDGDHIFTGNADF